MNKKITVRTHNGKICYFVIDPAKNISQQLAQVHGGSEGHGISYEMTETEIQTVDYYCNCVMFAHQILSVEETEEAVSLQWNPISE